MVSTTARGSRPAQRDPDLPVRCCLYLRVSSDEQAKEGTVSIGEQRRKCQALADARGWIVAGVFTDDGFTGTDDDRPELYRMMQAAREGQFQRVICLNGGRLSRDALMAKMLKRSIANEGIQLTYVEGDIDRNTDEGSMFDGVMDEFFEFQRKSLLRTMAAGARGKARDGRWPSSKAAAPWCFRVEGEKRDARLVPHQGEREIAELAARLLVDEGKSADEVCLILNAEGKLPRPQRVRVGGTPISLPSGKRKWRGGTITTEPLTWNPHRLRLRMTAESLLGRVTWGGGRFAVRDKATGQLRYGEPVVIEVEPVFSQARFDAIGQALTVFGPREAEERIYPWSGRLISGCGRTFVGTYRVQRGARFYRCQGKKPPRGEPACSDLWFPADELDARLWLSVVAKLGNPEIMREHARQHLAIQEGRAAGAAEELAALRDQAKRRREGMRANAQALIAAGVEPAEVAAVMKAEQDACQALERRANDIAAYLAEGKTRSDVLDQVARLAEHMAGNLARLDAAGQRLVVETLDLTATLDDPARLDSPITISSANGPVALVRTLPDVDRSAYLSDVTGLPSVPFTAVA